MEVLEIRYQQFPIQNIWKHTQENTHTHTQEEAGENGSGIGASCQ